MKTVILVTNSKAKSLNDILILVSDSKSPKGLIKEYFKKAKIIIEGDNEIIFSYSRETYIASFKNTLKLY